MAEQRWSYQVVDIRPGFFFGSNREQMQEKLNQMGAQGWELVTVLHTRPFEPTRLYFKRSL